MYSNSKFDVDFDFAIKRGLIPWFDWATDVQSQNDHQTTTREEKG